MTLASLLATTLPAQHCDAPTPASEWGERTPTERGGKVDVPTSAIGSGQFAWSGGVLERLTGLFALKDGWNGPGSVAVSPTAFYRVAELLPFALAPIADPILPQFVPTTSGGIQFEWHRPGAELEVMISHDGELSALFEDHEAQTEFEAEGDEARDLLLRTAPRVAAPSRHAHDDLAAPEAPVLLLVA